MFRHWKKGAQNKYTVTYPPHSFGPCHSHFQADLDTLKAPWDKRLNKPITVETIIWKILPLPNVVFVPIFPSQLHPLKQGKHQKLMSTSKPGGNQSSSKLSKHRGSPPPTPLSFLLLLLLPVALWDGRRGAVTWPHLTAGSTQRHWFTGRWVVSPKWSQERQELPSAGWMPKFLWRTRAMDQHQLREMRKTSLSIDMWHRDSIPQERGCRHTLDMTHIHLWDHSLPLLSTEMFSTLPPDTEK